MSATLTWHNSGFGVKTGTDRVALITDLTALINSKSGDANFKWQVASSSTAGNPNYLVLKRKDGSAGRILLTIYTGVITANEAIFDLNTAVNQLYGAWFPAGNVDNPSNLAVASGTILGDDTGVVKVWAGMAASTLYSANIQAFYFESDEAIYFGFQNPASSAVYLAAAGNLVVDGNDDAHGAVMSFGTGNATNISSGSQNPMPWTTSAVPAGGAASLRTNFGAPNRPYFLAWMPLSWATTPLGSGDVLSDVSASRAYFVPMQLLSQVKGEGFALKLRQFGFGPGTVGPFSVYNISGPIVAARQFYAGTTGSNGAAWLTNFKL